MTTLTRVPLLVILEHLKVTKQPQYCTCNSVSCGVATVHSNLLCVKRAIVRVNVAGRMHYLCDSCLAHARKIYGEESE
jgi:hypothetical protein